MHTPRTRDRHKSHEAKGDSSHSGTRSLLVFIKSNNRLFAFMDYTRHHWQRYGKQTRKQNFNSLIFGDNIAVVQQAKSAMFVIAFSDLKVLTSRRISRKSQAESTARFFAALKMTRGVFGQHKGDKGQGTIKIRSLPRWMKIVCSKNSYFCIRYT